jgi:hypothetical protein
MRFQTKKGDKFTCCWLDYGYDWNWHAYSESCIRIQQVDGTATLLLHTAGCYLAKYKGHRDNYNKSAMGTRFYW